MGKGGIGRENSEGREQICTRGNNEKSARIHRMTVTLFSSISVSAGFRHHLVGKALRNVCHSDIDKIGLLGRLMIIWTLS